MNVKISVVTVSLNNKDEIEKTILSVLSQKDVEIEYILVDGLSNDGTLDVISRHKSKIHKIVSEKDNGVYSALNKGIRLATGEVISFLHAGDVYADERVLMEVAAAFSREKVNIVYGDLVYLRKDKVFRYWKSGEFALAKIPRGWMPPHPAFFARRSLYLKYGGFDESYKISADYDLMMRFLWKERASSFYVPKIMVKMSVGGKSNNNLRNITSKSLEDYQIIKNLKVGGMKTLVFKNLSKLGQFWH